MMARRTCRVADWCARIAREQNPVDESATGFFYRSAFVPLPFEKPRKVRASRATRGAAGAMNRVKSATNRVTKLSFTLLRLRSN
jgi:hypothetical protein